MIKNNQQTLVMIVALAGILTITGFLLARPINLSTADIGRHIVNGRLFMESGSVPQGNLYSYTQPSFHFINHHWGSGVLFYLLHSVGGFESLSILYLLLMLSSLALVFLVASKASSPLIATLVAMPVIPLIATRGEVRPEAFSYFFIALFLMILWRYRAGASSWKTLIALPILAALWVNLHLFFIVGIGIAGAFFLDALIRKKNAISLGVATGLTMIASLLNPAGLSGAVLPLTISGNYGYRVYENQSVLFIEGFTDSYPPGLYFKILFGLLLLSWVIVLWRRAWDGITSKAIISIAFSVIAWLAIRNLAIFAIIALPIIASNLRPLLTTPKCSWLNKKRMMVPLIAAVAVTIFMINPPHFTQRIHGIGLIENIERASEFIKITDLEGPLFNNYDIGGYLIYTLYPKEKVFVDNRPEAYAASFFEDTYIPMQQRDTVWQEQMDRHQFNAIVFYMREQTEWGQALLVNRFEDPSWAPIYVDGAVIIFARRDSPNQSIIDQFELPETMFRVRKNNEQQ